MLVYGHNGSGKSSIVEAIEWLLYGEISRKTLPDCKSEYTGEYIKNRHFSDATHPYVEATFSDNNKLISLRREYTSINTSQTFIDEKKAEFSTLNFVCDKSYKPIMSQAEVKRFVEAQRKDKWNEILRIIGLESLIELRAALLNLVTGKKNNSLFIEAKSFHEQIMRELKNFKKTHQIISSIGKLPYDERKICQSIARSLGITKPSYPTAEALKKNIRIRMEKIIQPDSLATLDIPTDAFLKTELEGALKHIDDVLKIFNQRTHVDKEFIQFISTGLRYISDSVCPFCKEKTMTKTLRKELQQLVELNQMKLELENQLKKAIDCQKGEIQLLIMAIRNFILKRGQLPEIIDMLRKTGRYSENIKELSEIQKTAFDNLNEMLNAFESLSKKYLKKCEEIFSDQLEYNREEIEKLGEKIKEIARKIWTQSSEGASHLAQVRHTILLKTTDIESSLKLLRKLLCLEKLLSKMDLIGTFDVFKESVDALDRLCDNLERFERVKAQQLLKNLSKDVKKYYHALNPKEQVAFSKIIPNPGKNRWVVIKGESFGEELNPISCFSESHLNCLGLSLYFTQRVDRNPFWNLVILDDPVQSMDSNHSSNLVDIIAEICKKHGKQVMILTHQKSFANLIKQKFYYDDLLYYVFSIKGKHGPDIKLEKGSLDNFLNRAKNLSKGDQDDINDGGVNLRKGVEKFCFDVLTIKYGKNAKRVQKLDLEGFFVELEKINAFDKQDIADLRTIRSKADSGAHGNVLEDLTKGDLERGVRITESLKQKYL